MNPEVQFIEYVVKEIVENPQDVVVIRSVDEMGVLITLTVNPADMGRVIGKMGATAQAIRNLVRIVGMKNQSRVNVKITDPRKPVELGREFAEFDK